ncbi:large ribosomal subunit protein uL1m-like [Amphiura filiformis]|uniref:large ribosomal subunit protein uL1m-like n=1 Tax=Amphiura filiformis TaxID=82378 RepID=UPI003B223408
MATSMQRASSVKGLLIRCLNGATCQATHQHSDRRLHQLSYAALVAAQSRLLQQDRPVHSTSPCRTMCKYRPPSELYKTLYESDHPFYKVIKHKRKKYEPSHPLPVVKDPISKESSVLLYDDEETLRILGQAYLADKPTDDVYVRKHYPPQVDTLHEALDKLREQGKWDFNPEQGQDRDVEVTFILDEKLQKQKKVGAFMSFLAFPHQFTEEKRVLCIADGDDVAKAQEAGAYMVIGPKQLSKIVDGQIKVTKQDGVYSEMKKEGEVEEDQDEEVQVEYVDYIVASGNVAQFLAPLKRAVRAKYPTSKRGSVNKDVQIALELYKKGTSYECKYVKDGEDSRLLCVTSIGKLNFTNEQLEENLQVLIDDVVKHKPIKYGPFITEISVTSPYLDRHIVTSESYLPEQEVEEELDLTKELELLEQEMAQQRITQK